MTEGRTETGVIDGCFEGESADELIRKLTDGGKTPVIPVPRGSIDLNGGWPVRKAAPSEFYNIADIAKSRAVRSKGFVTVSRSLLYELEKKNVPSRYEAVSAWARQRFGFRVVSVRELGRENALRAANEVLKEEAFMGCPDRPYFDMMDDLGAWWSRPLSMTALFRDEPVGFLTVLVSPRSGETRFSCIQVKKAWRNRAVTAALAWEALSRTEGQRVEIGVIDERNLPSRYAVENTGARLIQCFERYKFQK